MLIKVISNHSPDCFIFNHLFSFFSCHRSIGWRNRSSFNNRRQWRWNAEKIDSLSSARLLRVRCLYWQTRKCLCIRENVTRFSTIVSKIAGGGTASWIKRPIIKSVASIRQREFLDTFQTERQNSNRRIFFPRKYELDIYMNFLHKYIRIYTHLIPNK